MLGLRTLVGTGSRQRHILRKSRQRCFHAYFSWGECSGGETTGVEPSGVSFPGGHIPVTLFITNSDQQIKICHEFVIKQYIMINIFTTSKLELIAIGDRKYFVK